jgi:DNA-nicking Smr family endonuclease
MPKLGDLKALVDAARARRGESVHKEPVVKPSVAPRAHPTRGGGTNHAPTHSIKRAIAANKHAEGDIDLHQAFADVERLPKLNKAAIARPSPAPVPFQRLSDERDALLMSKYGAEPAPHTWDIGQELEAEQTFVRPGLGTDILTKLRRGRWSVQGELDLHGMTAEESRDALADFLLEARARGLRCVRVIHGKGLTSPNREPVLKGKVKAWLVQKHEVLAFTQARASDGGHGALLVLLRPGSPGHAAPLSAARRGARSP